MSKHVYDPRPRPSGPCDYCGKSAEEGDHWKHGESRVEPMSEKQQLEIEAIRAEAYAEGYNDCLFALRQATTNDSARAGTKAWEARQRAREAK